MADTIADGRSLLTAGEGQKRDSSCGKIEPVKMYSSLIIRERTGELVVAFFLTVLVAACNSGPSQNLTGPIPPPALSIDSVNVRDYGALGDGENDDTPAFRSALAALDSSGGMVYIPAGKYLLTPVRGLPDRALDLSGRSNITISGDGYSATSLQLAPRAYQGGDTHLVYLLESSNITIRDLDLDGNRLNASFVDEQNHCVEVWRGSRDIVFERVRFHHCRGDGIRLIGPTTADAPWTERITIRDSRFEDNGRSGIAVQRGVRSLNILNNTFERISDQSIDVEPTGLGGNLAPTDIMVEENTVRHTSLTWALAMGGISTSDVLQRVTFRRNRIENGGVVFGRVDHLVIDENTIIGDSSHSALRLARNVTNLLISRNVISGTGGGQEGLLQVVAYNGAHPASLVIRDNHVMATAGQTGIYIRDALEDVFVSGNLVEGRGRASGIHIANIVATGSVRARFSVVENVVDDFGNGVHFSTRNDSFEEVAIEHNSISSALGVGLGLNTVGVLFDNTGSYHRFARLSGNEFGLGIITAILERIQ